MPFCFSLLQQPTSAFHFCSRVWPHAIGSGHFRRISRDSPRTRAFAQFHRWSFFRWSRDRRTASLTSRLLLAASLTTSPNLSVSVLIVLDSRFTSLARFW